MTRTKVLLLAVVLACFSACKKDPKTVELTKPVQMPQNEAVDLLKVNQIQVVGSHNSYRLRTYKPIYDLVQSLYDAGLISGNLSPQAWDYTHVPLPEQFGAFGMRGIELDIYEDVQGGRFAKRGGLGLVSENPESGVPELDEPGFKVLHIPDFDYNTNYYSFKSALKAVKKWSEQNPNHVPIFINIESKTEMVGDQVSLPFLLTSQPFTAGASDALDAEIKSVFGAELEGVITPDMVRGAYPTLREAVLAGNWPTLGDARGKVIFVMEGGLVNQYKTGHASLQGHAAFIYADVADDEAAFVLLNDPVDDYAEIQQAVTAGFIVRTRADGDTHEARTGDYTNMNAAFGSGAQIISTDYYRPDPRYKTEPQSWTDYHVDFPSGTTFRINPVSASNQVGLGFIGE